MLPPTIDSRDLEALVEQMKEMVPYYTPEWKFSPDDPDPGTTLFYLFAEMFLGNISRLNKVPTKNFISFLNLLNVTLLTGQPAQGYLTFQLNQGTKQAVLIPQETRTAAQDAEGQAVIFETLEMFYATPARPVAGYYVCGQSDRLVQVSDEVFLHPSERVEQTCLGLEEGGNQQEHCFYLSHRNLLNIKQSAQIEIEVIQSGQRYLEAELCAKLSDWEHVEWWYSGEDGWEPFYEAEADGNVITLHKSPTHAIVEKEIEGVRSRWIKCCVKPGHIHAIADAVSMQVDGMKLKPIYVEYKNHGGMKPDMIFHNDIELDQEQGFYPFGEYFTPFAVFYLSSQEVFSKRGSQVTLSFELRMIGHKRQTAPDVEIDWKLVMKRSAVKQPEVQRLSVLKVLWEYWDGQSWVSLLSNKESEEMFCHPDEIHQTVTFTCPENMEETFVNSRLNYWIRVRVVHMDEAYSHHMAYLSPYMENLRLQYHYDERFAVEHGFGENNLEVRDLTPYLQGTGGTCEPLYALDTEHTAVYLGFDTPPLKGPLSLYLSVSPERWEAHERPLLEWQYRRRKLRESEWSKLQVEDDTDALTRSGTVQFVGPEDFVKHTLYGRELYWIRVVNLRGRRFPRLQGLHMNTVRVRQQQSFRQELPVRVETREDVYYQLAHQPVLHAEVWVDETEHLNAEEVLLLQETAADRVQVIQDSNGGIQKCWVKWEGVAHFLRSLAQDRHYHLDAVTGRIRFGDGKRGRRAPQGLDKVRANYSIGGGTRGNVERYQINKLLDTISFVQAVSNLEPTGGGSERETVDEALVRGSQMLKHRNRAVTAEDFELLAKQAVPSIAKVKCLANYNEHMERESGCVTLVVLTKGGQRDAAFFPELKRQVERSLLAQTANTAAAMHAVRVIAPVYLEVSVVTSLVVEEMEQVVATEMEAARKLRTFLDPLSGNYDGRGWEIGQSLHSSVFYGILKSLPSVRYVEKLVLDISCVEHGKRREVPLEELTNIPHGIVVNGEHKVSVKLS